jgi:hypothetical protein
LQPQAREKGEKEGFEVSVAKTSFKANTKALAENEGEGLAKDIFCIFLLIAIPIWDIKVLNLLLNSYLGAFIFLFIQA